MTTEIDVIATLANLLSAFESLGHNCELHFVLRAAELDETTLLRDVWVETPEALVSAISRGFADLFAFERLEPKFARMALDRDYQIAYHTAAKFDFPTKQWLDPEDVRRRIHGHEVRKITARVVALIETFRRGDRIFVFKHTNGTTEAQAVALHRALTAYGPNRLVVVNEQSAQAQAGTVREVAPGLYMGTIRRFSPLHDVADVDIASWIRMLQRVRALDRERQRAPVARLAT